MQPMLQKVQEVGIIKWIMIIAPILGAAVTFFNFTKIYDGLGLPRPVFTLEYTNDREQHANQLLHVKQMLRNLETEFRNRNIKSDLRAIRDLEKEIIALTAKSVSIPDSLMDFKSSLEESIAENRSKLKDLEKTPIQ